MDTDWRGELDEWLGPVAGPPPQPSLPAIRQAIIDRLAKPPDNLCPHCGSNVYDQPPTNLPK
jgi:hypothetical protein